SPEQAIARGIELQRAGRYAEARAIYYQILTDNPNHADALNLLGVVAGQCNLPMLAIELIGKAIRVNPGAAAYHGNLGEALRLAGRMEDAIRSYASALALDPEGTQPLCNLAGALSQQGRADEAIRLYERALHGAPDNAVVHY